MAVGSWSVDERKNSSTFCELQATGLVLKCFAPLLTGKEVQHRTDNKYTEIILPIGSRKSSPYSEAVNTYMLCREFNIPLSVEWISRDLNGVADELSQIEDSNDSILPVLLTWTSLGPHIVDRFVSLQSRQLDRLCSRFLNPGCEAVDAFTVSWAGDHNWMFPPPYLVPHVLRHVRWRGGWNPPGPTVALYTLVAPAYYQAWYVEGVCNKLPQDPTYDGIFIPGAAASCVFTTGVPLFLDYCYFSIASVAPMLGLTGLPSGSCCTLF